MDDFGSFSGFQGTKVWNNIGCLLSAPTFGLRGLRLYNRDPNIIVKKRKISLIQLKVDLYEVCASLFQILSYYYYFCTDTSFTSARFVASITLGERSLGSIDQEALKHRYTRSNMSGLGQGC